MFSHCASMLLHSKELMADCPEEESVAHSKLQPYVQPFSIISKWLTQSSKLILVRLSQVLIVMMAANLMHPTVYTRPIYSLCSMSFIMTSLGMVGAARKGADSVVQQWFAVFAGLQIVYTMAHIGIAPAVQASATSLTTLLPKLLVTDLSTGPFRLFLQTNLGDKAAFYMSVVGHKLPLAIASCLYAMVACVYLAFRSKACAAMLLQRDRSNAQQNKERAMEERQKAKGPRQINTIAPNRPYRSRLKCSRVAVTIQTPLAPSQLPAEAFEDLVHEVERSTENCLSGIAARPGCLVVSFNLQEFLSNRGRLSVNQQSIAGLCQTVSDVAKVWVKKYELTPQGQDSPDLSVQVSNVLCSATSPASSINYGAGLNPAAASQAPQYTLSLPFPALLIPPSNHLATSAARIGGNTGRGSKGLVKGVAISFEATICVPADVDMQTTVCGWTHADEGGPEEDKIEGRLHVLASVQDAFLPVQVLEHRYEGCSRHSVRVMATLPSSIAASSAGALMNCELWRAGLLMSCHNVLLLPNTLKPVLLELQSWAAELQDAHLQEQQERATQQQQQQGQDTQQQGQDPTQQQQQQQQDPAQDQQCTDADVLAEAGVYAYISDLGEWMQFAARGRQQVSLGEPQGRKPGLSFQDSIREGAHVASMATIGKNLLFSAVRCGMVSLSGILVSHLTTPPFCLPFDCLVTSGPASMHDPDFSSPAVAHASSNCMLLLAEALQSGSAPMLAQVLRWGRALGGPGFSWPWSLRPESMSELVLAFQFDPDFEEMLEVLKADPVEGPKLAGLVVSAPPGPEPSLPQRPAAPVHPGVALPLRPTALLPPPPATGGTQPSGAAATALRRAVSAACVHGAAALTTVVSVLCCKVWGAPRQGQQLLRQQSQQQHDGQQQRRQQQGQQGDLQQQQQQGQQVQDGQVAQLQQHDGQQQQLQQAGRATAGPKGIEASYSAWLLSRNKLLVSRWALIYCLIILLDSMHPATAASHRPLLFCMQGAALGVSWAAKKEAFTLVRGSTSALALLQVVVIQNLSWTGAAPAVHTILDLVTNLFTLLPYMLVLNLSPVQLCAFVFVNAWVGVSFYLNVAGHSLFLSILRAAGLQVVCVLAFITIRRNTRASYFKELKAAKK